MLVKWSAFRLLVLVFNLEYLPEPQDWCFSSSLQLTFFLYLFHSTWPILINNYHLSVLGVPSVAFNAAKKRKRDYFFSKLTRVKFKLMFRNFMTFELRFVKYITIFFSFFIKVIKNFTLSTFKYFIQYDFKVIRKFFFFFYWSPKIFYDFNFF